MEAASAAPAADKRRHPFPWLNLMATEPFYLLHFLLFFSYLGARSSASQTLSADLVDRLFRREIQAILAFLVLVAVKMVKEETWEAFVANTLLYAKGFLFAIALVIDYHLALCYLLGFLGMIRYGFCVESCFIYLVRSGHSFFFFFLNSNFWSTYFQMLGNDKLGTCTVSFLPYSNKKIEIEPPISILWEIISNLNLFIPSSIIFLSSHNRILEKEDEKTGCIYRCMLKLDNQWSLLLAHILAMRIYTFSSMKLLHRLFRILSDNDAVFFFFCFLCLGDCSQLTPLQLESLLTEGSTSRFWLVEFRALCSSTCVQKCRIFPDLSVIYSNKNISFGVVDIGHFPNAAEKFGISLPGQIPTYILFENAVEVARLPEFSYTEASVPTISKKLLCQHFELDRRLIQYVSE
ncbi:unnamed protein product [Musa hybrid cultivar]